MENLRKLKNGKFSDAQKQYGRWRGVPTSVTKETPYTTALPPGTAERFVNFADTAAKSRLPLNTLLTVRWHALLAEGADYLFLSLPPRERIARTVVLLRKFTTGRGSKFPWIWVQENGRNEHGGLHWHLAFHSNAAWHNDLLSYVECHFGVARLPAYLVQNPTEGELGRSDAHAWHLSADVRPERNGRNLALYLGKGDGEAAGLLATKRTTRFVRKQGPVNGKNKDRFSISRTSF